MLVVRFLHEIPVFLLQYLYLLKCFAKEISFLVSHAQWRNPNDDANLIFHLLRRILGRASEGQGTRHLDDVGVSD